MMRIACYILLTILAVSCVDSREEPFVTPPTNPSESKEKEVLFSVHVPQNSKYGEQTRALTEAQQQSISEMDVLAFKLNTADNKYYYAYHAEGFKKSDDDNGKTTFTFTARALSEKQQFVIVANARHTIGEIISIIELLQANPKAGDISKESILKSAILETTGKWATNGAAANTPIAMWGESASEGVLITPVTDKIQDEIRLLRMLARIDVKLDTTQPIKTTDVFELKSVRLYNYPGKGCLAPAADHINSSFVVTAPTLPDKASVTKGPLLYDAAADFSIPGVAMEGTIYLPEVDNATITDAANATCLVVGGSYNGTDETFYRVEVADADGNRLNILRNHQYMINITEVQGKGYATADEAFASIPVNIKATVMVWDQNDVEYAAFDKNSSLAVSQSEFTYPINAVRMAAETDNRLNVQLQTRNNARWYIKQIEYDSNSTDWLMLRDAAEGRTSLTIGPSVTYPAGDKELLLCFSEYITETALSRTATVVLASGRLEVKVKVTQAPTYSNVRFVLDGVDVSTGEEAYFEAFTDQRPAARKLEVIWVAEDGNLILVNPGGIPNYIEQDGASFWYDKGWLSDTPGVVHTETLNIWPDAILNSDPELDKWEGRVLPFDYYVSYDKKPLHKTVTLFQKNYNLEIKPEATPYLMDNKSHGVTVLSNFPWKASVGDGDILLDAITEGGTGSSNYTTGSVLYFRYKDLVAQYSANRPTLSKYKDTGKFPAKLKFERIAETGTKDENTYPTQPEVKGVALQVKLRDEKNVLPTGGIKDVNIEGRRNFRWAIESTPQPTTTDFYNGNSLITNHTIKVQDNNGAIVQPHQPRYVGNGLQISMPYIWYPNREKTITTEVTVYMDIDGDKITIPNGTVTVKQDKLTKRVGAENVWEPINDENVDIILDYGAIGNVYWGGMSELIKKTFANIDISKTSPNSMEYRYIHLPLLQFIGDNLVLTSKEIETKVDKKEKVLWLQGETDMNSTKATDINKDLPYGFAVDDASANSEKKNLNFFTENASKRIYKYLTGSYLEAGNPFKFKFKEKETDNYSNHFNWVDGISIVLKAWPEDTTVPIIYSKDKEDVILAVDPVKQVIFLGESQLFSSGTDDFKQDVSKTLEANKIGFQLVAFARECAAYGAAFSDMLTDNAKMDDGTPIFEPWDDVWGANKYTPKQPSDTSYWPLVKK
ncbi:MAG: hypothetical protein LBM62_03040 [Mediterranea sp.]|jgi:hypothetical protein|nr:hypothetical protein [Mediterranea sp.]